MWPLLLASLVGTSIILERTTVWYRSLTSRNLVLREDLLSLLANRRLPDALALTAASKDVVVRVIHEGLQAWEQGQSRNALDAAVIQEMGHLKRGLPVLDTIVTIAPLLGILGTVLGIIGSFHGLGGGMVGDPKAVSSGIGEALITTAFGLGIAIFTVVPLNWFWNSVENTTEDIEALWSRVEVLLA
jgi:biopolymer transport protein ExbB